MKSENCLKISCIFGMALLLPLMTPYPVTAQALVPLLQAQARTSAKVTGTVFYLQRIALAPNAVVEVKLQEVSRLDAPAVTIAEQTIQTEGRQPPFSFELSYDPSQIDPRYTYVVQARITVDGELQWINTNAYRVITQGNPTNVEIIVQPARPSSSSGASSPSSPSESSASSSTRYDCESRNRSFKTARNVSLDEAKRLRLQRDGNEFVYRCAPTTARPSEFRYNCRAQVGSYPDRSSIGLAEAEQLLLRTDANGFVYQCEPE